MNYLNVGCGSHYSTKNEWTNIDFVSNGKEVLGHNLLNGIPFPNEQFQLVYHSHVLEHFSQKDGEKFISECFRVLQPGGVIRIAIPDLEKIVKKYLALLEAGAQNPEDPVNKANYNWMLLEMYDQTVRNIPGGNMKNYLFQETMINEQFVLDQIGQEGMLIRQSFLSSQNTIKQNQIKSTAYIPPLRERISQKVKNYLLRRWKIDLTAHEMGKFRLGGEIHQWMYDRYSLSNLLKSKGFAEMQIRDAFTSYIPDWTTYQLDGKDNIIRKPDSLFIEAIKK